MDGALRQEVDDEDKKAFRFTRKEGGWFFENEDLCLGPFFCLRETVMEEYRHHERELREPELSRVLAEYS